MLKYRKLSNCIRDFKSNILKSSQAIVVAKDYSPSGQKCVYLTEFPTLAEYYLSYKIDKKPHSYEVI